MPSKNFWQRLGQFLKALFKTMAQAIREGADQADKMLADRYREGKYDPTSKF